MQKKVSVIMPVFNGEKFLFYSIRSILSQTHKRLELIVINDNSSDSTLDVITQFSDKRIKLIELKSNVGAAKARNEGLKIASGTIIAFCDADDVWTPKKLSRQLALMTAEKASVCHANCNLIDANDMNIGKRYYPRIVTYKMMRHRNYICNSGGLYDTKALKIRYQRDIFHEDYLMWLDIIKEAKFSVSLNEPLLNYRIHSNNVTKNKINSLYCTLKVQLCHGIPKIEVLSNLSKNIASRIKEKLTNQVAFD